MKIPPILENIKIFSGSQVQKESFIQYVNKYKNICEKNGYSFDMKWEYDEEKAEEFDRTIERLK